MRKFIVIASILFINNIFGQVVYIDAVSSGAILSSSVLLQTSQNNTIDKLADVNNTQTQINAQLLLLNDVQQKVKKGLTEVNAILQNSTQVLRMGNDIVKTINTLDAIQEFITDNPQYSVFAVDKMNQMYTHITSSSVELQNIIQDDENSWMNAGQRKILLTNLAVDIRSLNMIAWSLLSKMKRAKRLGFLNSINPFAGWVNDDVAIMNNIISETNNLGM